MSTPGTVQVSDFNPTVAVANTDIFYSQNVNTGFEQKTTALQLQAYVQAPIANSTLPAVPSLDGVETFPLGKGGLFQTTLNAIVNFTLSAIAAGSNTPAAALTGSEIIPLSQNGELTQTTVAQLVTLVASGLAPQRQSIPVTTANQAIYATNGYTPGLINVFVAGIRLNPSRYTATDGQNVVITDAVILSRLQVGMSVDIDAITSLAVADVATTGAVQALMPVNQPAVGTLTGAELVSVTQSGSLFQSTLNKIANFIMGLYAPERQSIPVTSNGQTTYVTGGYTVGLIEVFISGVRLDPSQYQALDGIHVVITDATVLANIVAGMTVSISASVSIAVSGVATPASVAALIPSNQPAIGTITGAELVSVSQNGGLVQSTLSKIATFANGLINPANLPGSAALTGSELTTVNQGGSLVQSSLTNNAAWATQTYAGFTQTGTGAVARTVQNKMRDVVSILDFYNGNWNTALTNAIAAGYAVEIPASAAVVLATGSVNLPAGTSLIIKGSITGNATSLVIPATCDIIYDGGWTQDVCLNLTGGGPRIRNPRMSGYTNTQQILINGSGAFTNLVIDGLEISNANYGILRVGGTSTLANAQITRGQFNNLKGDAIEWNVTPGDVNVQIVDHVINSIDAGPSGASNWGIGIGVAGASFDNTFAEDFVIAKIKGRSLRQLIHVEAAKRFTIAEIEAYDISSAYSVNSGVVNATVVVYGSSDFVIDGVRASASAGVLCEEGTVAGSYLSTCQNYVVRNVSLVGPPSGSATTSVVANSGNTGTFCRLENIDIHGGFLSVSERPTDLTIRNVRAFNYAANGPALQFSFDQNTNGAQAFRAASPTSLTCQNVTGHDENFANSASIAGVVQNVVRGHGNNFNLAPTNVTIFPVNRTFFTNVAGLPYGVEAVPGDLFIDESGVRNLCTVGGSLVHGSDNFSVISANVIQSTNLAWTSPNMHSTGQQITLPGCGASGAALPVTVVGTQIVGGHYQMTVSGTIVAVAGTTGTIAATNTPTFVAV
jgi:colanic acid biosynthesis protein WcaM